MNRISSLSPSKYKGTKCSTSKAHPPIHPFRKTQPSPHTNRSPSKKPRLALPDYFPVNTSGRKLSTRRMATCGTVRFFYPVLLAMQRPSFTHAWGIGTSDV
jgi:hypothetical protein